MLKQIVAGFGALVLAASANASLIENGDFENGLSHWNTTNLIGGGVSVITDPADSSNHIARLDDPSSVGIESLWQDFYVPAGVDSITVSFDYKFEEVDNSLLLTDSAWAKILKSDSGTWIDFDVLGYTHKDSGGWVSFEGRVDTTSLLDISPNASIIFNIFEVWGGVFFDKTDSALFIDNVSIADSNASATVPEPSSLMLLGLGLLGFGLSRKRAA